jgi:hypothetical protein
MGVCHSVGLPVHCSICQYSMYVLMGIDTKSASGGPRPSQRPIISLDTPRCTPSTAFQTRSGFD